MHADRLSRCWPQGRAQDKAPLLVPVLSLTSPLSKRGTSRSPCQQEPQARGAGLCQWSLDALVLGTLREPWETGLVTTTQGQSWEDKLPPWNLAQGQHWAAPRSGEPPRILAGGQASHPHSSCHAQSSALGAGPQSQSRRLGSPAPPAEPHHCPHGQAWTQCVGPRGSAHLPAGCCIWRLHTRLRKRAAASCWFSTQDMGQ